MAITFASVQIIGSVLLSSAFSLWSTKYELTEKAPICNPTFSKDIERCWTVCGSTCKTMNEDAQIENGQRVQLFAKGGMRLVSKDLPHFEKCWHTQRGKDDTKELCDVIHTSGISPAAQFVNFSTPVQLTTATYHTQLYPSPPMYLNQQFRYQQVQNQQVQNQPSQVYQLPRFTPQQQYAMQPVQQQQVLHQPAVRIQPAPQTVDVPHVYTPPSVVVQYQPPPHIEMRPTVVQSPPQMVNVQPPARVVNIRKSFIPPPIDLPAGQHVMPAGQPVMPAGQPVMPAGQHVIPTAKTPQYQNVQPHQYPPLQQAPQSSS